MLGLLDDDPGSTTCGCRPERDGDRLLVDASECPDGGDLVSNPACRRTAIDAIGTAGVDCIRVERSGLVREYTGGAAALFGAAGAFAERVAGRDARLASVARRDPVEAATEAAGRAGLVGELADQTGLSTYADSEGTYADRLRYFDTPAVAASRIDPQPPSAGTLRHSRILDSGATVRVYDRPDGRAVYHLEPIEYTLEESAAGTLQDAKARLAAPVGASETVPGPFEAVRDVADPDDPVDTLAQILAKHTSGYGVFEDLFCDPQLSEIFVNAPAPDNPLHVRVDGEELTTNVRLTARGVSRLAATLRAVSGRPFSRASPRIDTSLSNVGSAERVRVAGVREPASEGLAFALRADGTDSWRLPTLVETETVSVAAAGLLSVSMARGAAILVAGPRGAGKTTMASALLWELEPSTRLLAIEDTPELPVAAMQAADRDVQRLEAAAGPDAEMDPATALRTALRFGDGALAVGEVRGEEVSVLYEAMRVGAASDTVIGTIHGEGYAGVKERVVADLGVPESSFAATDLLVTLAPVADGKRVMTIEEVTESGGATLFRFDGEDLAATPRLSRGNSRIVADLTEPADTYAETMAAIETRASAIDAATFGTGVSDRDGALVR